MDAEIRWVTASPLWARLETAPARMRAPTLLRFASDAFMDDLAALLEQAPAQLNDHVATAQSFRSPAPGARAGWTPPAPSTLKLFQPVHGHFNLIAANLVCRVAGLPDHVVDAARAERVAFVLRRIDADGSEMAWVTTAAGRKQWQRLALGQGGTVAADEERLPLFPLSFVERSRRRRLLLGLIPTASRETFEQAPVTTGAAAAPPIDPRLEAIKEQLLTLRQATEPPESNQVPSASLFILFDLADYLVSGLGGAWAAALESATPITSGPSLALYTHLSATIVSGATTWLAALRAVWARRDRITNEGDAGTPALTFDLRLTEAAITALMGALTPVAPTPAPAATAAAVGRFESDPSARYVARCIFERPSCRPPHPAVVSDPSDAFTLAPFFDPDAPGRPIRIALPGDTSIGGLRKFKKNVEVVMSSSLRQQLGCGNHDLSFSIPIITLCATIVLMIFIVLLNIIFWWLPFLRVCKPKVTFP